MKKNSGNIAMNISVIFGSIILILIASFAYYMVIKPKKLEINTISYTQIDQNEYNVNSDELNEGLFTTMNFKVDNSSMQMHKDLHDVYVGRDNPFTEFTDNREDTTSIDELNSTKSNESTGKIDTGSEDTID